MSAFIRFKSAIARRLMPIGETYEPAASMVSDAGEMVTQSSAMGLSTVWACVNLLAGTIASLPFGVYRSVDGRRVAVRDHPLFRILHDSPNYDQTALDFWEFVGASIELAGNGYASISRDGKGRVVALDPIHPQHMHVRRAASGALAYEWTDNGKRHTADDTGILHIRGFGGGALGGLSTLHHGRNVFGAARAVDRASGAMFKNGLRPTGALKFLNFLTAEQRDIAETKIVARYVGAQNSGRPMILEGGAEWEQLSISPDDAQMLETRRFSVEEICRMFGVPPHMIGHTENSTSWGSGLEQQTLGFQKFTLRKRLARIEQAIDKQLLSAADRANGLHVRFSLEGLLRGDTAGRAMFYKEMTGMGAMTINEVRALENMAPLEGGDVSRIQSQNIPITEPIPAKPIAAPKMEQADER